MIIKDLALRLPDGRELFNGLNATFCARQFTGIIGPNGSGKSMLAQRVAAMHCTVGCAGRVGFLPQWLGLSLRFERRAA